MVALVGAAMFFVVAACGSGGEAKEGRSSTATVASTAVKAKSDRPREIKLNGLKACDVLTAEQRLAFGVDQPLIAGQSSTFNSPSCTLINAKQKIFLGLVTITTQGIEEFAPGKIAAEVRSVRALGFPAYELWTPQEAGWQFCVVAVDVADGQVLHAKYSEDNKKDPLGRDEVCKRAAQVADATLTTLMAAR